jgi:basic membrane protein A and related proteins
MKTTKRALAVVAAVAMLAAACGEAPDEGATGTDQPTSTETSAPTETTPPAEEVDYLACQVTDTGGVDDRSFNQTAYKGLQDAESNLGVETKVLESQAESDFEPHINEFISQGCDMIITVGFLLGDATRAAAEANADQHFAIVDYDFADFDADGNYVGDVSLDNVKELTFATDEAAFLAGYLAAGMTETDKVGTYGGLNIPTVSIFMDGFLAGVRHHNAEKGTNVEVLGWDGTDGLFAVSFEDQQKGRDLTDQLLANGADIIMPVAGPVGLGSAAALQEAGKGKLIWVDTDGFVSASQFGSLMLTSVMKNMDVAVEDVITADVNGEFEGGLYVGTLENEGVDIAPFHEFEDEVPQELKDEIDALRQGIIAGEISVKSADYA